MVDWGVARRIGAGIAGDPGLPELAGDLDEACREAAVRVAAYTLLEPAGPLPAPELLGRPGWLDANLAVMAGVIEPVASEIAPRGRLAEPVRAAAGLLIAAEVGGLAGLLAQRVLGQYEMPPLDPAGPTRLLFVAPNLRDAARRLEADEAELVRWVALHEVTHAIQFSAVGWLRGHVAELLGEVLEGAKVSFDWRSALRRPDLDELRALVERVRGEGLVALALGPERRATLERVQATMAMVEGHAEHTMDAAGGELVPNLDRLRAALERRRRDRHPLLRLLERLTGMELKLRQYEVGKRFCDAVVAEGGVELLNRAWESPARLPSWEELEAPAGWVTRVTEAV